MQKINGKDMSFDGEWPNPLGTQGFEFLEFAGDSVQLNQLFKAFGFVIVGQHKKHAITMWQQGDIRFIVNGEKQGSSAEFAKIHGPCACAMAFRVEKADFALEQMLAKGARIFDNKQSTIGWDIPAVYGIGDSVLYLVDEHYRQRYAQVFDMISSVNATGGGGLTYLDHVTHNVYQGNMDKWAEFYERHFNFKEIKYFDIKGQLTGLKSRAMTSPCGQIRIPINESVDDKSQIVEYLDAYHGEGIQHIALGTENIYATVDAMRANGIEFLDVPDTYYAAVDKRVQGHQESVAELKRTKVLIDGAPSQGDGILLQLFTKNLIGPIFFEMIQRKGNNGFGEGNFQALFEAMEQDQIARGVLKS